MALKEDLIAELEATRGEFLHLLETVPEQFYGQPSANPAWTIGDVLYHITLGPPAIRTESWMIRHAGWLFSAVLNNWTSGIFNWGNALFAHHPKRITSQLLRQAYERGHAGLLNSLRRMPEADLGKSIVYPAAFVAELAGEVSVERLFRYVRLHFEVHAAQIRAGLH